MKIKLLKDIYCFNYCFSVINFNFKGIIFRLFRVVFFLYGFLIISIRISWVFVKMEIFESYIYKIKFLRMRYRNLY